MKFIKLKIDGKGNYKCKYNNMDYFDIITFIVLLIRKFKIEKEILKKII